MVIAIDKMLMCVSEKHQEIIDKVTEIEKDSTKRGHAGLERRIWSSLLTLLSCLAFVES